MKLIKARIQNYRSIRDTGYFDVEEMKTIMVGPNEAGKSAILSALQQINAPDGTKGFDPLRDYPRALYNDITVGKVDPARVTVVEAEFSLDDSDQANIPKEFRNCTYTIFRELDNTTRHQLNNAPELPSYGDVSKDLMRMAKHLDREVDASVEVADTQAEKLKVLVSGWNDDHLLGHEATKDLRGWLDTAVTLVEEENATEENRLDRLRSKFSQAEIRDNVLRALYERLPIFVLYSNYFRVHPTIHLGHLAKRLSSGVLDDGQYDYGNQCLLKILGFEAQSLSELGNVNEPDMSDADGLQRYKDQLDNRTYQLNAASVKLTGEIRSAWFPDPDKAEADKLRIHADGQYLKVVVEDDLGVEIELNQRSEGFQWLVSFFVVFFAEADDRNQNAILLLDEPGLHLHALKQREFRKTISRLAQSNQTIYTTHSPFLVGPDELDLVRVVEMTDRSAGTLVHSTVTANDPAALLPLQEALGYDLAQSLFSQRQNLVLEGLTDYWYVEAVSQLLKAAGQTCLDDKIALVPANSAGKVVYFATILHSQKFNVAALLDSDNAGDQVANQDVLIHTLGNKRILRTNDHLPKPIKKSEIEDLLRHTLMNLAKDIFGWDVINEEKKNPETSIVKIFAAKYSDFSKYKLSKAFVRWTRDHEAEDLSENERAQFSSLFTSINKALK